MTFFPLLILPLSRASHLAAFGSIHYFVIIVVLIVAYGMGGRMTVAVDFHSGWERAAFRIVLGLATLAYCVFCLGCLHLLYPASAIALLVVAGLVFSPVWARDLKSWVGHYPSFVAVFVALVFLSPLLLLPLYPPTTWDSTMYHLAVTKVDIAHHGLYYTPYMRYSTYPQLNEMLFTLMLLLKDDIAAVILEFTLMILLALALFAWGKRCFSARAGIFAVSLWLSSPLVLWLASTAYVDVALSLFVFMSMYAFSNWTQTGSRPWLYVCAAMLGFGCSTKYLALFALAGLGLILLYLSWRQRNWQQVLAFSAIVLFCAAPWYVRNLYYTHNPVWPFAGRILGHYPWSDQDLEVIRHQLKSYGGPKTLGSLLRLPWSLSFNSARFRDGTPQYSVLYFYLLPFAVLAAVKSRAARFIVAAGVVYVLFWFFSYQVLRYLTPAIPFLCLAMAAGLSVVLERLPLMRYSTGLTVAIVAAILVPGWQFALGVNRTDHIPVNQAERDAYITSKLPAYPAYVFLNRQYGNDYTIYTFGNTRMTYFANGTFRGDWLGPDSCGPLIAEIGNWKDIYAHMRALNADFFLYDERDFRAGPQFGTALPEDDFFRTHFRLIWAGPYIKLFQLSAAPVELERSPELLRNPDFQQATSALPSGWEASQLPPFSFCDSGLGCDGGPVEVGEQRWLWQRVSVRSGALYEISHSARSAAGTAHARLQLNWVDATGRLVRSDIEIVQEGQAWMQHAMATEAPEDARWVDVYVTVYGAPDRVCVRRVSLVQLWYEDARSRGLQPDTAKENSRNFAMPHPAPAPSPNAQR